MSLAQSVLAVFPPPRFIAVGSAGVDISDRSIKCATLERRGTRSRLASYAEIALPEGAVVDGDIQLPEKVVETLRSLRLRHGVHSAYASLPEKKCFLYQAVVPGATQELRSAIEFDLETHVPLPPKETMFDFEVMRAIEGGTVVSVTAYAKRIVDSYTKVFQDAGITLRALEAEPQSITRAVLPEKDSGAVMVIDCGAKETSIMIAEYGVVTLSTTIDIGSDALTASIAKFFSIPLPEAEQMKIKKGFLVNAQNADLVEAMITTISVLRDEVMQHLSYWNTLSGSVVPHQKVRTILLSGGGANLIGFPEYLEGATGIPVSLGNVWVNAFPLGAYIPPMPFSASLAFAAAVGLAERDFTKLI